MGSPQLKAKRELNYRRGTISKQCSNCRDFMSTFDTQKVLLFGDGDSDTFGRCVSIGIQPGRAYRISPDGLCDKHDNSEYMKRLKAGTSFEE
jgi:hypothetical protein